MKGLDYDALFPGRFIKAGDLAGKDVTVMISGIELEDLPSDKGGDRTRGILSFQGAKRKLVLNRTNGECIKAMFGRDTGEWIGKRITLFASEWNGEPCIRVKGSPDLEKPVTFELKLPRKKPRATTMLVTGKAAAKDAGPAADAATVTETLAAAAGEAGL